MTLRLPDDLHRVLVEDAERHGRSLHGHILHRLRQVTGEPGSEYAPPSTIPSLDVQGMDYDENPAGWTESDELSRTLTASPDSKRGKA